MARLAWLVLPAIIGACTTAQGAAAPTPAETAAWLNEHADREPSDPPFTAAGLGEVRTLSFSRKCLGDDGLRYLVNVPRLVTLYDYNDGCASGLVTGEGLASLAGLTDLTFLDLDMNHVEPAAFGALGGLAHLSTLKLGGNGLAGKDLSPLSALPALETLYLNDDDLDDAAAAVTLPSLRALPKLRSLVLSDNPLGDAGLAHLAGLGIESLNLGMYLLPPRAFVHLAAAGAATLAAMPALRTLLLSGAKVDPDVFAVLLGSKLERFTYQDVAGKLLITPEQYLQLVSASHVAPVQLEPEIFAKADADPAYRDRLHAAFSARPLELLLTSDDAARLESLVAAGVLATVRKASLFAFPRAAQDPLLVAALKLPALQELLVVPQALDVAEAAAAGRPEVGVKALSLQAMLGL